MSGVSEGSKTRGHNGEMGTVLQRSVTGIARHRQTPGEAGDDVLDAPTGRALCNGKGRDSNNIAAS